jgi:hypothetical protein
VYRKAIDLGAEVVVLGEDAGHRGGPMIPPSVWRELVLPYHHRIVDELEAPVIWHSDGNIESLLSMAIHFIGYSNKNCIRFQLVGSQRSQSLFWD